MAGDWIKIERDLPHKPEVMRMAEMLGIDELQVVGHLVLFWSWCDANMSLDCPDVIGTKRGLDRASCRDGMVDALLSVGWLELISDFGHERYRIPNFERHLSKSAKTRATEQRKKQQQRSRPLSAGDKCPDANGTTSGPEKRREEINNIEGRASEHRIPDSLNDSQCRAAAEKWFDYLDSKQLQDKSPRGNEIQLESWWRLMAKFGRDGFLEAVTQSIAAGRWNVELKASSTERARPSASKEWLAALKAAKSYPKSDDWEKRKKALGEELFEALKRTGSRAVAESNDWEQKTLKELFESHLKDIRNGTPVSN
jgi:hypothetical protein